jgi:hypothetical protein
VVLPISDEVYINPWFQYVPLCRQLSVACELSASIASEMSARNRGEKSWTMWNHRTVVPGRRDGAGNEIQEVILKAMAGKLKWWEAAEIIGVTDRTIRRWRKQYEEHGYSGLWDYRKRSRAQSGCRSGIWSRCCSYTKRSTST